MNPTIRRWTQADLPTVQSLLLETWLDAAEETPGSWWVDWDQWLKRRSGKKMPAREPGRVLGTVEPAPGRYVKVRYDER